MDTPAYTHDELVSAVWYKTWREIDQNPGLAHHSAQSLYRCVQLVLTESCVSLLVKKRPGLREQFARTVAWWRAEIKQQTGALDDDD